jgi:hypothetical protein
MQTKYVGCQEGKKPSLKVAAWKVKSYHNLAPATVVASKSIAHTKDQATTSGSLPRSWQTKNQNLSIFVSSIQTLMNLIRNNVLVNIDLHGINDPLGYK